MTVIVIAHRLSTIVGADKIYALKDGVVIEEGMPKDLLDNEKSYFYKMYNLSNIF